MKKFLFVLIVTLPIFVFIAGCDGSSRFLPPVIAKQKPILLKTDDPDLDGWTVPPGAHLIPDSYFVVLDDKPVDMLLSAIGGGAAGVMIHHSLEAASQKKRLGDSENLYQFDLKSLLNDVLAEEIIQRHNYELIDPDIKPPKNSILLQLRAYIGTTKENLARIHTIIETKAPAHGKRKWWNRYIYYSTEWKPLTGPQSWAEGGQELIKAEVRHGIEQILNFFLDDILSTPPEKKAISQVTAKYMRTSIPKTLKNIVIIEQSDDRVIVHIEKPSDITFDGVHFLPRSETTIENE
jgi:hypothetical protein